MTHSGWIFAEAKFEYFSRGCITWDLLQNRYISRYILKVAGWGGPTQPLPKLLSAVSFSFSGSPGRYLSLGCVCRVHHCGGGRRRMCRHLGWWLWSIIAPLGEKKDKSHAPAKCLTVRCWGCLFFVVGKLHRSHFSDIQVWSIYVQVWCNHVRSFFSVMSE